MGSKVLDWVKVILEDGRESDDDEEEDGAHDPARLYECPDCGTIYIRTDPQPCSECNTSVDPIANERDLGLTSN